MCDKCGFPRAEHSYTGACYGLCGEFVARKSVERAEVAGEAVADLSKDEHTAMWHVIQYLDQEIRHQNPHAERADIKLRLEKWLVAAVVKCLKIARASPPRSEEVRASEVNGG